MPNKSVGPIYIDKGQYLSDILDLIPSNSFVLKNLPNIGATQKELWTERNSLIVVPNVPVIAGKQTDKILGVYEGIYKEDIIDYLYKDYKYKKIMVTPESFNKVKEAIEEFGMDMHNDFFLLFDECERVIQDVSYRKNITLPLDDFFKFKHKAFMSATFLEPSDPRFKKQRFTKLIILPKYDASIPIELITTDNILFSIRNYLKRKNSKHYCIFLNSTDTIASVIKTLNIKNESHVFCAKESVLTLKANDLPIASSSFDVRKLKKFNFFSSRFNSAVDLKVDFKPDVLILTDLTKALHSMVDPSTQVIQIVGRWRNGYNSISHISNLKESLPSKSREQIISYLEGCESGYNSIKDLRQSATSEGARDILNQCLKLVEYADYINTDGSKNYYMIDNEIHKHRVNGYYCNAENLLKAYERTKRYKITYISESYPLDDTAENKMASGLSKAVLYKMIADILLKADNPGNQYSFHKYQVLKQLRKMYPHICDAYRKLGYEKMALLKFKPHKIADALYKLRVVTEKQHFGFITALDKAIYIDKVYTSSSIINILRYAINKYGLKLKPTVKLLECYFEILRTTKQFNHDGKEIKGYRIIKRKYNLRHFIG